MINYSYPPEITALTGNGSSGIPFVLIPRGEDINISNSDVGFIQGEEDLWGENSCLHKKQDGFVTMINKDIMKRKPDSTGRSVYYFNNRSVGTHPCPFKGSHTYTFTQDHSETHGFKDVQYEGCVNDGHTFVFIIIRTRIGNNPGRANCNLQVIRYNKDYTRRTVESIRLAAIKEPNRGWTNDDNHQFVKTALASASQALAGPLPSEEGRTHALKFEKNPRASRREIQLIQRLNSGMFSSPPNDEETITLWGELAQEAIKSMDILDFNGLMYLQEMKNIRSLLPPIKDIRKLTSLNPKAFANVYLWLRYGVKLSIRDTKLLISKLPAIFSMSQEFKDKKNRLRARANRTVYDGERDWKVSQSIRILCDSYPENLVKSGRVFDALYSLDLVPTLENIWDMIPYSFVVDWLIPVSSLLDNLDTRGRLQSFTIHACTRSIRYESDRTLKDTLTVMAVGHVVDVHYKRMVSTSIPTYGLLNSLGDRNPGSTQRLLDGGALLLQRF